MRWSLGSLFRWSAVFLPLQFAAAGWCVAAGSGMQPFRYTASILVPALPEHRGDAMGLADFDEDGTLDMAYGLQAVGIVWRQGLGDGNFGPKRVVDKGGIGATWLQVLDLDADGHADLLAGYYVAGKVAVFAGDGRGGFSKVEEYSIDGGVHGMAVADFDHDGGLDIAVHYQRGRPYFVRILWSRGLGKPREPGPEFEGLGMSGNVSAGDFDGDGWPDLAVSHSFDRRGERFWPTVSFYWNDGGALRSDEPYTIAVDYPDNPLFYVDGFPLTLPRKNADFDGDGVEDLVVPAVCAFIGMNQPRATPTPAQEARAAESWRRTAATGALASLPLALVSTERAEPWLCGYVMIVRGDRRRELTEKYRIPTGQWPRSAHVRDLDGDGSPDIAVGGEFGLAVLYSQGGFRFEPHFYPDVGNRPNAQVESGDVNGDGLLDLVQGTSRYMLVIPAIGPRRYPAPVGVKIPIVSGVRDINDIINTGVEPPAFPSLVLCDIDLDGAQDIIVSDGFSGVLTFFNRPAERNFAGPVVSFIPFPGWQAGFNVLLATDANRDGHCDLLFQAVEMQNRRFPQRTNLGVLLGDAQGSFTSRAPVYGSLPLLDPSTPAVLSRDDLIPVPLEHETAFLIAGGARSALWRFGVDGSPQEAQLFVIRVVDETGEWLWSYAYGTAGPWTTAVWDVDGDGDLDIVTVLTQPPPRTPPYEPPKVWDYPVRVGVYLRDGDSFSFTPVLSSDVFKTRPVVDGVQRRQVPIAFVDVDEDGMVDVVWFRNASDSDPTRLGWSRGLPGLRFSEPVYFSTPAPDLSYGTTKLADVNGDGRKDIVLLGNGVTVLEGLDGGEFGYRTIYTLATGQADALGFRDLVDLDLDGRPDSIVLGDFVSKSPEEAQEFRRFAYILYNLAAPPPVSTPTQTRTPGVKPTPTPWPTPLATPTPRCTGDCNRDGRVTVDEVVRGVMWALGSRQEGVEINDKFCGFDADGDRRVFIDEVVRAVGFLLSGCP